jgi:HSP20 family protein
MSSDLTPKSYWSFPSFRFPSIFDADDDSDWMTIPGFSNGLSISEDEKSVYVEAALPGVKQENIDITFDKGYLWIKGEAKEEETEKKYYRKASSAFSYRVAVPGELDQNVEPEAIYKDGIMKISFAKVPKSPPKKITIKSK